MLTETKSEGLKSLRKVFSLIGEGSPNFPLVQVGVNWSSPQENEILIFVQVSWQKPELAK